MGILRPNKIILYLLMQVISFENSRFALKENVKAKMQFIYAPIINTIAAATTTGSILVVISPINK